MEVGWAAGGTEGGEERQEHQREVEEETRAWEATSREVKVVAKARLEAEVE